MRPRVLLGNLEPLVRLGMSVVLQEDGIDVVGEEARPAALTLMASRLHPDAVVLDLHRPDSRTLTARVQAAAPHATVVLWSRDEDAMEVFDPGSPTPRRFSRDLPEELRGALTATTARSSIPRVEE